MKRFEASEFRERIEPWISLAEDGGLLKQARFSEGLDSLLRPFKGPGGLMQRAKPLGRRQGKIDKFRHGLTTAGNHLEAWSKIRGLQTRIHLHYCVTSHITTTF